MDFEHDARATDFVARTQSFMDECVYPAEATHAEQATVSETTWKTPPVIDDLRREARARGLWNLFLPGELGGGLTNLQYAPVAELSGRSIHLAPIAMNCAAPDTGNMEVLTLFATPEQRTQWLEPLLRAEIRSAFAMTEPAVASSDATNIELSIRRDGPDYVVNGRKWWTTGAVNRDCAFFIVMGKTDPTAERHRQQSMIIVPRDAPGVTIERPLMVFGYLDAAHGGHGEVTFDEVRVPASNLIGGEGEGFAIAQARLGPGRIHHCMRAIGVAERALELMCRRVDDRIAFGKPLSEQGVIRDWIAESRVRIEQVRLLCLKAAWLMDTVGNRGAHTEIQAIKIATPVAVEWILDKAIQAHGAAGLSQDLPLGLWFAQNRALRFADGPDEVHRSSLARAELTKHR